MSDDRSDYAKGFNTGYDAGYRRGFYDAKEKALASVHATRFGSESFTSYDALVVALEARAAAVERSSESA